MGAVPALVEAMEAMGMKKRGDLIDVIRSGQPFWAYITPEQWVRIQREIRIREEVEAIEDANEIRRRTRHSKGTEGKPR